MTSQKPTVLSVVRETSYTYWGHTSMGGLAHAYHAHGFLFRVIWLALFCYGLYMTINDVRNVVNDYLANLHTSQMDIIYDRSASFPAVTICNQNRIDCERLVGAALLNFTYEPLQIIVNESSCLRSEGLACPYVWALLVNQSLPDEFRNLYEPYCLECEKCEDFAEWSSEQIQEEDSETRTAFETIFVQIGCSSTCGPFGPDGGGGGGPGGPGDQLGGQEGQSGGFGGQSGSGNEVSGGQTQNPGEQTQQTVDPGKQTQSPGDQTQSPSGETQGPGGQTQIPGGETQGPVGQTQNPGGETQGPDGQTQNPGGETQDPGERTQNPVSGGQTQQTESTGGQTRNPGEQTQGPNEQTENPGAQTQNPGGDTQDPGQLTQNPAGQTEVPGQQTQNPGEEAQSSGEGTQGPGEQTQETGGQTGGNAGTTEGPAVQTESPAGPLLPGGSPGIQVGVLRKRRSPPPGGAGPSGPGGGSSEENDDIWQQLMGASETYNKNVRLLSRFMTLPFDLRAAVGSAFDELIMDCTYLGAQCSSELLFNRILSPQYGNCYTFNTNVTTTADSNAGKRLTGLTGELYSFNLLLYLKHYAYPPTLTATKGARIEVHPPDVVPDVEENGLNVLPNTATSFAVEQMTIKRLRSPYEAQCVSEWSEVDFYPILPISGNISGEKYNGLRCKKLCLQHHFHHSCRCFHPMFPPLDMFRSRGHPVYGTVPPCDLIIDGRDYNCTSGTQQLYDSKNITCNCPPSCFETSYNVFPSTTFWPRDSYLVKDLNIFGFINSGTAVSRMGIDIEELTEDDLDDLATNILEMKIFFKTLNTARLEQSPYISTNSLMSALGGAMSLYLGISIIMLAEVFEYISIILWNVAMFTIGRYKPPQRTGPEITLDGMSKVVITPPHGAPLSFINPVADYPSFEKPVYTPPVNVDAAKLN